MANSATSGTVLNLSGFSMPAAGKTVSTFVVGKQTGTPGGSGEMSLLNISPSLPGTPSISNLHDYLAPALLLEANPSAPTNGTIGVRRDGPPNVRPTVPMLGGPTTITVGNTPFILDTVFNGTVGNVALKTSAAAATLSSNVPDTGNITGGFYLGREYFNNSAFPGDVGEVLLFTNALNATDRTTVENYLYAKWIAGTPFNDTINFPNTNIVVTGSATLDMLGSAQDHTLGSLNLSGVGTNLSLMRARSITFGGIAATGSSGTMTIAAGTPFIQIASGGNVDVANNVTLAINSVIGGTSAINKTNTGALLLAAANTYSGSTTVVAGTLTLGASEVIPDVSPLTVNAAGTLIFAAIRKP